MFNLSQEKMKLNLQKVVSKPFKTASLALKSKMKTPWQEFTITEEMKKNLARQLEKKESIFSIESDPLLASLCSCLGLQSEMGDGENDRLSIPLGLNTKTIWKSEIITHQNEIGIRFWVPGLSEIRPLHSDFGQILHPFSLDQNGLLSQIVVFPTQVARTYKKKGFELDHLKYDWNLNEKK